LTRFGLAHSIRVLGSEVPHVFGTRPRLKGYAFVVRRSEKFTVALRHGLGLAAPTRHRRPGRRGVPGGHGHGARRRPLPAAPGGLIELAADPDLGEGDLGFAFRADPDF